MIDFDDYEDDKHKVRLYVHRGLLFDTKDTMIKQNYWFFGPIGDEHSTVRQILS